jgi:hypothetical protein
MTVLVYNEEACPDNAKLKAWVEWWKVNGPFPIKITEGRRDDEAQLKRFEKGRGKLSSGQWIVVDKKAIITNAMRAFDSAHGHDAAIDCYPVRELYPSGGVKLIYLGDEKDLAVRAEAQKRLDRMAELGIEHGLESGRSFPFPDKPHLQDPAWRTLPAAPGVAIHC